MNFETEIKAPGMTSDPARPTEQPRTPARLFALKHQDTFMVADGNGDILGGGDGLFRDDTRVLSRFVLTLGGFTPTLLSSDVSQDNVLFTANLTNRPLPPLGGRSTPEGVIHIERQRMIWRDRVFESVTLQNFADVDALVPLELSLAADFRDMFEVRGIARAARGVLMPTERACDSVTLRYRGLDALARASVIQFSLPPQELSDEQASFAIDLPRNSRFTLYIEVGAALDAAPCRSRYRHAAAQARWARRSERRQGASVRSTGSVFNRWIDKSRADLALLTTTLETGPYPYAGIPWFSTPFGRDAIVTAMQMLWLDPSLARGVLAYLAVHQASEFSSFRDSAPGKIMHETRRGEMAALDELPFRRYYGGVDTTPLFVMLAGAYATRTGDLAFIDGIWSALEAAMGWVEGPGDSNHDGLVDYSRGAHSGLANQGWKDSHDSIFHADGSDPAGPIALVEVQGFCFAAFEAMADLSARRGAPDEARRYSAAAVALRETIERLFWLEDERFYAIAIDGAGAPCRVRASNAGQLLYSGAVSAPRARCVIDQILAPHLNSGWGVRTLARGEARFNPMSYHNGSVWPHDTAMCAAGMARYGERSGVVKLTDQMFAAAVRFEMRLPELYCGFHSVIGEGPVAYPVACLPQAWASGSVFMLLQSCLGLTIDGWRKEIHVSDPRLPDGFDTLTIRGLRLGDSEISIKFQRIGTRVVAFRSGGDSGIPIVQSG